MCKVRLLQRESDDRTQTLGQLLADTVSQCKDQTSPVIRMQRLQADIRGQDQHVGHLEAVLRARDRHMVDQQAELVRVQRQIARVQRQIGSSNADDGAGKSGSCTSSGGKNLVTSTGSLQSTTSQSARDLQAEVKGRSANICVLEALEASDALRIADAERRLASLDAKVAELVPRDLGPRAPGATELNHAANVRLPELEELIAAEAKRTLVARAESRRQDTTIRELQVTAAENSARVTALMAELMVARLPGQAARVASASREHSLARGDSRDHSLARVVEGSSQDHLLARVPETSATPDATCLRRRPGTLVEEQQEKFVSGTPSQLSFSNMASKLTRAEARPEAPLKPRAQDVGIASEAPFGMMLGIAGGCKAAPGRSRAAFGRIDADSAFASARTPRAADSTARCRGVHPPRTPLRTAGVPTSVRAPACACGGSAAARALSPQLSLSPGTAAIEALHSGTGWGSTRARPLSPSLSTSAPSSHVASAVALQATSPQSPTSPTTPIIGEQWRGAEHGGRENLTQGSQLVQPQQQRLPAGAAGYAAVGVAEPLSKSAGLGHCQCPHPGSSLRGNSVPAPMLRLGPGSGVATGTSLAFGPGVAGQQQVPAASPARTALACRQSTERLSLAQRAQQRHVSTHSPHSPAPESPPPCTTPALRRAQPPLTAADGRRAVTAARRTPSREGRPYAYPAAGLTRKVS